MNESVRNLQKSCKCATKNRLRCHLGLLPCHPNVPACLLTDSDFPAQLPWPSEPGEPPRACLGSSDVWRHVHGGSSSYSDRLWSSCHEGRGLGSLAVMLACLRGHWVWGSVLTMASPLRTLPMSTRSRGVCPRSPCGVTMSTSWGCTLKLYKYPFSPNFPFICISVDYGFVGELSVTAWYVSQTQPCTRLWSHTSWSGIWEWLSGSPTLCGWGVGRG